jgi:ketosteroid isomerase-like protein
MINEPSRTTDEARIRTLIEERVRAVRHKDIDALMSRHAPDVPMFDAPESELSCSCRRQ